MLYMVPHSFYFSFTSLIYVVTVPDSSISAFIALLALYSSNRGMGIPFFFSGSGVCPI
ncbi:hypothetical protein [Halalkalibacter sp. APA_J-10(15)]|uniref:hypothetical protein n=1 Tax=Halalkalibacter sp. APA_J-10(15) TaxID=2933805 RepID=UPI001FF39927|nr:hypothetical protein [Halalkalibacter sp. APA_J-10(15)]MCK0473401.1 hypothetical protein [Halalkalibacter sp. APA_J-10(15)]